MTYLLGSDLHAAITTEHSVLGISIDNGRAYVDNVLIGTLDATDNGADTISTVSAHNLSTGDPFMFTMDDDSPSLALTLDGSTATVGTTYYAIKVDADDIQIAETYANAIAGTEMALGGGIAAGSGVNTNITRELTGANTSGTLIKNREWPKYDGTGRIDTIAGSTATPEGIEQTTAADLNTITDLTGVDFSIGTVDEDISFYGQRTNLKSEIKNEITVSLTRKKSDNKYSSLFNTARCGVMSYTDANKTAFSVDSSTAIAAATLPTEASVEINNTDTAVVLPSRNFGYRIHIMLKTGVEVLTLRNCCMTGYSVALNSDGVTEETLEFYGNVKPKITNAAIGHITSTPEVDL